MLQVSLEAACTFGWERWVGPKGKSILYKEFCITKEAVVEAAKALM